MSDARDRDLLAAEYVLGVLEGGERREAETLLAADESFATAVRAWEERLMPLAHIPRSAQPDSALWDRIEASIAASGPSPALWDRIQATTAPGVIPLAFRRRLRFWRAGAAASLAIAASLAAFILLHPGRPPDVAVLMPTTGGVSVLLATVEPGGVLTVRPRGAIAVPDDRDLELWVLGAGETRPRSLGVMPASGRRLKADLPPGVQLLVSLEPRGGSPTGQPTGPVLFGGQLTARE